MSGCFSLRLQYFARKCQAYHGSLQAAVKSKDSVEIKDEQVCIYIHVYIYIYIYCMNPPNNKATKCTLFSIQYFIFQGQRSQALTGLATAHCEHRWGQLTLESPFRIVESG